MGIPRRFEVARPDPDVVLEHRRAAVGVPSPRGDHRNRHLTRVEQAGQRGVASMVKGNPAEPTGQAATDSRDCSTKRRSSCRPCRPHLA